MATTNKKRRAKPQPDRDDGCITIPMTNRCKEKRRAKKSAKSSSSRADEVHDESQSIADEIVKLAIKRYRIGRTQNDEAFVVERAGPNNAIPLSSSSQILRSALSRDYRRTHGKTPKSAVLGDAITALHGEALEEPAEEVYLRVADHDGKIVIDLGDPAGRAVIVSPDGWEVVARSPVLFRRTAATGKLPVPERGGALHQLRGLLNVTDETWPLVQGFLVAALIPELPHPILLLGGEQGTGKTTAAKALVNLFDPSPAPVRTQPREARQWVISASASWGVCIDNVSFIPDWLSDALCKAVTGDGWLDRKLYTDGDLFVLSFRRVIMLTSIDTGTLRGDLGDRVLLVDLEPIAERKRLTEKELITQYQQLRPRLFGALLDLLAAVLKELPGVELDCSPRMADFARVLSAMDKVTGSDALETYMGQRDRVAEVVIESDPVAVALRELMDQQPVWEGTADELRKEITPPYPFRAPTGWPQTPHVLGGRLKRLAPALKQLGIEVHWLPRSGKRRPIRIVRVENEPDMTGDNEKAGSVTAKNDPFFEEETVRDRSDSSDDDLSTAFDDDLEWDAEDDAIDSEPYEDELAKLGF